jgi:tetratricopeptide (TPR) repeat protein
VVSQTVAGLARTSPFGLALEDLHWADAATLDWLEHYLTTDAGIPLVGTWRSEDLDTSAHHADWLDRVRRLPCVHEIGLTPLSREETAAQLRLLDPGVEDGRVGRIHERSRGHPLFTEQLARGTDASDVLPEALVVALDRRLARLAGPALDVVRVLGVADRRLAVPVLERATGLGGASLLAGLRDLDTSHLIRGSPTGEVTLAHPLLAEAARRRLAPGEAPVLHAALADALAGSRDASPGELAVHWQAACRPEKEIDCRIAAARLARERLAYREELASWLRALELYDSGVMTTEVELWDLLRRAMSAAYEAGDAAQAVPLMHRALALDLPDVARVHVLQTSGDVLYDAGDQRSAMQLLDESHALVLRLNPDADLVDVVASRFWALVTLGQVHAALQEAGQALAHLSTLDDPRIDRFRRAHGIVDRVERGDFAGALALAEEQGRAAHGRDLWLELMAATTAVDVLLQTSEPPQRASDIAGRALLAAEPGQLDDTWPVALLRSAVSSVHLRAGDTTSAGDVLEPSTRSDPTILTWTAHACMAAVELRRGEVDRAVNHSRAVQAQVVNHDFTWAELVPLDAEVALWAGEVDSALALLERAMSAVLAVDAARRAGDALALLARAVADRLGQTTDQGERATAHDEVVGWRARCIVDPLGPRAVAAATPAWRAQWECELARILATDSIELWVRAASAWDRLGRPHDAAYCRWRAARVALRDEQGTVAARLLRKAAADAREHVPLSEAIAATRSAAR